MGPRFYPVQGDLEQLTASFPEQQGYTGPGPLPPEQVTNKPHPNVGSQSNPLSKLSVYEAESFHLHRHLHTAEIDSS